MKVIVAGSRTIEDADLVREALARSCFDVEEVVSGAARGVDELGEQWAEENGVPVRRFPARWEEHGKAAGPRRNESMAAYADALVAVWDGQSAGTRDMLQRAYRRDLPIFLMRTGDSLAWTNRVFASPS